MPLHSFFPTRVYVARLQPSGWQALNGRLQRESLQLREDDRGGRDWSKTHYPGGYTSYGSLCRMHTLSPTFDGPGRQAAPARARSSRARSISTSSAATSP